ncbi:MAG: hypothetical protein CM15mP127_14710 [Gammaproteobacteria bacterium]|nr:MAG: hypothetical protein CM15mP127_14710 [Gammaproteobacteria bacterium]
MEKKLKKELISPNKWSIFTEQGKAIGSKAKIIAKG